MAVPHALSAWNRSASIDTQLRATRQAMIKPTACPIAQHVHAPACPGGRVQVLIMCRR